MTKKIGLKFLIFLCVSLFLVSAAQAEPTGPALVCELVPNAERCQSNTLSCSTCHTTPPARNDFGLSIEGQFGADDNRSFDERVREALSLILDDDSDGDGTSNRDELLAGTEPGDSTSRPAMATPSCADGSQNPSYNVCGYDFAYAFKKVSLDFCGTSPNYDEYSAFKQLADNEKADALALKLDGCLSSVFWKGRDGVLWRLAHAKIRPLAAVKSGANAGAVPLGDYDDDYPLFVYTQTGDTDARDVLKAQYYVSLTDDAPPTYRVVEQRPEQALARDERAGMISTRWFMVINTMFTPMPRTTAAQAYRSYLGLDIARSEGLIPPNGKELIDYDEKGITDPKCSVCHTTLDPLSYPFSRYNGISGRVSGAYDRDRLDRPEFSSQAPRIEDIPESGFLFGIEVDNLVEWADVAANSDAFAQATVTDYWRLTLGHRPTAAEMAEFDVLWRDFKDANRHNYRVEKMLHALIRTEAYGVP